MSDEDLNRRKGARGYVPKVKAQPPGPVVSRSGQHLLIRKNKKPMPWANFVVWLTSEEKRKRSFHIAWNGSRFNVGPEIEALEEREPVVYRAVLRFLEANGSRYVREPRRRRQSQRSESSAPGHDYDCGCYECQEYQNGGGGW